MQAANGGWDPLPKSLNRVPFYWRDRTLAVFIRLLNEKSHRPVQLELFGHGTTFTPAHSIATSLRDLAKRLHMNHNTLDNRLREFEHLGIVRVTRSKTRGLIITFQASDAFRPLSDTETGQDETAKNRRIARSYMKKLHIIWTDVGHNPGQLFGHAKARNYIDFLAKKGGDLDTILDKNLDAISLRLIDIIKGVVSKKRAEAVKNAGIGGQGNEGAPSALHLMPPIGGSSTELEGSNNKYSVEPQNPDPVTHTSGNNTDNETQANASVEHDFEAVKAAFYRVFRTQEEQQRQINDIIRANPNFAWTKMHPIDQPDAPRTIKNVLHWPVNLNSKGNVCHAMILWYQDYFMRGHPEGAG